MSTPSTDERRQPSLVRRLMPGLTLLLILPMIASAMMLWHQHERRMRELASGDAAAMAANLQMILATQADGLATAITPIAADPGVRRALPAGDADALMAAWRPIFEVLQAEGRITHMYFLDAHRTCLLRLHDLDTRGDRIGRFTALEAERTRQQARGLELGPRGTLTLRVVQPVVVDGRLLGYVELGKEIGEALVMLRSNVDSWSQMAILAHKDGLDRAAWEDAQRRLGRTADWDRLPNQVVVTASQGRLSDAVAAWVDPHNPPASDGTPIKRLREAEIDAGGQLWQVVATPITDASGTVVGDLLALRDITGNRGSILRHLLLGGAAGVLVVVLMLAFVHRLLARTDQRIVAQQASLRNERWRLGNIIDATRAGTWEWDMTTDRVIVSERWAQILGWTVHELGAMNRARWESLFNPSDLEVARGQLARHCSGELPFIDHECQLRHRDGHLVWIHCRGRIFARDRFDRPSVMFGTHSDITARKEGEFERERLLKQQQASQLSEMLQSNRLVGLGTLMAGMAHEFNHPAQVVLLNQRSLRAMVEACVAVARDRQGTAVGLLTWSEVAELAPSLLDDLESATSYLQELIESVRSYARPEDDACERVDQAVMANVATASLRLVSSYARRRQITLVGPRAGADPGAGPGCSRLQQVVVNLLINAIQASPPGSSVHLDLEAGQGVHSLHITDAGDGIDPQIIDRLGRPFVTTKGGTGGSGLGLYISHHLVTALGGSLVLAPRRPRGTIATVAFPTASPS